MKDILKITIKKATLTSRFFTVQKLKLLSLLTRLNYYSTVPVIVANTRRFIARPSLVLLSAIG